MGKAEVQLADSEAEVGRFMRAVLKDLSALERMLEGDWFETDPIRIGAEQEVCLVDAGAKAAPWGMQVLERLDQSQGYTTEYARFNLEVNLTPRIFTGACLRELEHELNQKLEQLGEVVRELGGEILLTGILPTFRPSDLDLRNLTPLDRYRALAKAIMALRGSDLKLQIQGGDELLMNVDSPLLEACNTGFQIHLQVAPADFVSRYNIAQAIAGPALAAAVGSPFLFGKRLWGETRIALFQQSVDIRAVGGHLRETSARVNFGSRWVDQSVLEIYREDAIRHRVMLSCSEEEDVDALLAAGVAPELNALNVHNGTVYRWNRACYGVGAGRPHLRIENRVLPSGPTVTDEMANTALWLGLLNGMPDHCADVRRHMDFDTARHNFVSAAKFGLESTMHWMDGRRIAAAELVEKELIPIAREGLRTAGVDAADIDGYLGVMEERMRAGTTASSWMLGNYNQLTGGGHSREQALTALTKSMIENQAKGEPIHKWGRVWLGGLDRWRPSNLLVEEFMTTDVVSVRRGDILEFVEKLMEWNKVRYVPVEDEAHRLVGLVTMRGLFRRYADGRAGGDTSETVAEVMLDNPITIHPEASIMEAMDLMTSQRIGCLPVIKNNRLVGIITESNFIQLAFRLSHALRRDEPASAQQHPGTADP